MKTINQAIEELQPGKITTVMVKIRKEVPMDKPRLTQIKVIELYKDESGDILFHLIKVLKPYTEIQQEVLIGQETIVIDATDK